MRRRQTGLPELITGRPRMPDKAVLYKPGKVLQMRWSEPQVPDKAVLHKP